jgi:hypothetical protein
MDLFILRAQKNANSDQVPNTETSYQEASECALLEDGNTLYD